jgi:hypothetical protein
MSTYSSPLVVFGNGSIKSRCTRSIGGTSMIRSHISSWVLRNTKEKEEARTRFVIPEKLRETVMELCRGLPSLAIRVQRELCLRLRINSIVTICQERYEPSYWQNQPKIGVLPLCQSNIIHGETLEGYSIVFWYSCTLDNSFWCHCYHWLSAIHLHI